jgi:hypothetical protein
MPIVNAHAASEIVCSLLQGAQLDTLRIYSLVMQLGFFRPENVADLPAEAWVSLSGTLVNEQAEPVAPEDFFERRASALSAAYRLIGQRVTSAHVLDSGALRIRFGERSLRVEADDTNLEEVWSVMSDSSEPAADHSWWASLHESGELSAHAPRSSLARAAPTSS